MRSPAIVPAGLQLATIGGRAVAALIDAVVNAAIWFPFFWIWGYWDPSENTYKVTGLPALAMFLVTAGYWILPEWFFGATLGKSMCDLRVVSLKGKKCSFSQSVKRNLLRVLDFFGFCLVGFIAAKLSPLRQRLGDRWAGTIVVVVPD